MSDGGFRAWFIENLGEEAGDILQHGADQGFSHITYTKDCVEIYDKYKEDIWTMLTEGSESFGYDNPIEFIATFKRTDMAFSDDGLKNLLVWYACECMAYELDGIASEPSIEPE